MRRSGKVAVLILLLGLTSGALLEVGALILYGGRTGELYYLRTIQEASPSALPEQSSPQVVLHPYFGYTQRPGLPMSEKLRPDRARLLLYGSRDRPDWLDLRANNLGFFSEHDVPYPRGGQDEFIIGVFGGSVAHWFSLQGRETLEACLAGSPELAGRRVVLLNFSQGGYRQPQQLLVLSYLLAIGQELDLALNISGFNEIALAEKNLRHEIDESMPSIQHVGPLVSAHLGGSLELEAITRVHELARLSRKLDRRTRAAAQAPLASLYLLRTLQARRTRLAHSRAALECERLEYGDEHMGALALLGAGDAGDLQDRLERALEVWERSSLAMQRLSTGAGIEYLEIVQPNQYHSDKWMSPAEQAIALSEKSSYRKAVESGYPMVESWVTEVQGKGLRIVSGLRIFDPVEGTLYSDNACHYNQTGNDLLARFVAGQISRCSPGLAGSPGGAPPPPDPLVSVP